MLSVLLLSELVTGQNGITVKGNVTDDKGNPLIGANVVVIKSTYGSSTDGYGAYFIYLPASEKDKQVTVEARFVGYISQSKEIKLTSETTLQNFILEEDVLSLKTVVVTAQRREEDLQTVPISITAIESEEIINKGAKRVFDLRYSVPNLNFGPGNNYQGGIRTSIRGIVVTCPI